MRRPSKARPKVRYAVVGAGWISQEAFMPSVAHTGNSVMTAIVTGDPEKAAALGRRYRIEHSFDYGGYDRMLRAGVVDAVYIALPNTMHRDYAVRALDAGIHVLCEKPMARTEADCRAMIAAAEKSRAKLMVAYRLHFEPATIAALETVRAGAIGEPRLFSSAFGHRVAAGNHRLKGELWGGPIPDLGPYPINAVRHLFASEPVEVVAASARKSEARFAEVEEMAAVTLRFPGEQIAQFTVSCGMNPVDAYRITGTKGDLEVNPGFIFGRGLRHRLTVGDRTSERLFDATDQFGGELRYFSDCILEDREPEPDGEEGLADVRIVLAIERAIETGRPQRLERFVRGRHPERGQVVRLKPVRAPKLVNAAPPAIG